MVRNDRVVAGGRQAFWDLPGGSLRRGERLVDGLRREWREETGLDADVGDLQFVLDGRKQRPDGVRLYTWRAFFFRVTAEGNPTPGEGIDEVAWVDEADVIARLEAPYHEALRRHLAQPDHHHGEVDWIEDVQVPDVTADELRHVCVIAAAAAVGARDDLERELATAQDAGVEPARILEALLQVVPYAGYPRAITALGIARKTIEGVFAADDLGAERAAERGRATFEAVYGDTTPGVLSGLEARDPVLARWTIEHAYGRVLCRDGVLTLLERELLAVSILTAMGGLEAPLLGHMRAVLRLGGTEDDVRTAVQVVPASFGEAHRDAARALIERLHKR